MSIRREKKIAKERVKKGIGEKKTPAHAPLGSGRIKRRNKAERKKGIKFLKERRKQKRFERNMEAYEMRLKGYKYKDIAERFGKTLPQEAYQWVQQAMVTIQQDTKEDEEKVKQLEIDRMDCLLHGMWDSAIHGHVGYDKKGNRVKFPPNPKAADAVLKIMKRRSDLLGLDKPKTTFLGNDENHPLIENTEAKLISTLTNLAKTCQKGKDEQLPESEITAMEEMVPIKSTNIKKASYNEETEVLTVQFKTGKRYEYLDVPPNLWDKFMAAKSQGSFFHKEIRRKFEYIKVD